MQSGSRWKFIQTHQSSVLILVHDKRVLAIKAVKAVKSLTTEFSNYLDVILQPQNVRKKFKTWLNWTFKVLTDY